jgi:hypothetical protein
LKNFINLKIFIVDRFTGKHINGLPADIEHLHLSIKTDAVDSIYEQTNTGVDFSGLPRLLNLKRLELFSIYSTNFTYIRRITSLSHLTLVECGLLTNLDQAIIQEVLTNQLEYLVLSRNSGLTELYSVNLSKLNFLYASGLSLRSTAISNAIKTLCVPGCKLIGFSSFEAFPSMTELDVSETM